MQKKLQTLNLEIAKNDNFHLTKSEQALAGFLAENGLPSVGIFIDIAERTVVFNNVKPVIQKVNADQLPNSIYLSKFFAAVSAGLFDAALNYLWDQTIYELRKRVSHYDLSYFYDNAVKNEARRSKLKDEDDLVKIDDSELISGAKSIELIGDMGFHHLDYIKYMRNWASAAHPNQNEITGLQLVSWLETCIREVVSLPLSTVTVEIKKLLDNIKTNTLTKISARDISPFFSQLTNTQMVKLLSGFFGIYVNEGTSTSVRQNIVFLLPDLWRCVSEPERFQIGIRYGRYAVNNDEEKKTLSREFLNIVSGEAYIPDNLRSAEIQIAIDNLLLAHRGTGNFSAEYPFAKAVELLVSTTIPDTVEESYVHCIVEVFLTNGNGVSWSAEPIYLSLISNFTPKQSRIAMLSVKESSVNTKLRYSVSAKKFDELLELISPKIIGEAGKDLIEALKSFKGPKHNIYTTTEIRRKIENFEKITK